MLQIEQVCDDILDSLDRAGDSLDVFTDEMSRFRSPLETSRGCLNRSEWGTNVVPDDGQDPLPEVGGNRELLLIAPLPWLLGFVALVDVDAAPNEASKLSALISEGNAPIEYPAIVAVTIAQAVLHFEWFAPAKVFQIVTQATIKVVPVNAFRPAIAKLLLEHAARKREPGLVEVVAPCVSTGAPNHHRRIVNQQPIFPALQHYWHRRRLRSRNPLRLSAVRSLNRSPCAQREWRLSITTGNSRSVFRPGCVCPGHRHLPRRHKVSDLT